MCPWNPGAPPFGLLWSCCWLGPDIHCWRRLRMNATPSSRFHCPHPCKVLEPPQHCLWASGTHCSTEHKTGPKPCLCIVLCHLNSQTTLLMSQAHRVLSDPVPGQVGERCAFCSPLTSLSCPFQKKQFLLMNFPPVQTNHTNKCLQISA